MAQPKSLKRYKDDQEVMAGPEHAPVKSILFDRYGSRACLNPFCRSDFVPKRKDQRFCGRKCKETFFKVKYALLILAPYFNVDLDQGPEGKG